MVRYGLMFTMLIGNLLLILSIFYIILTYFVNYYDMHWNVSPSMMSMKNMNTLISRLISMNKDFLFVADVQYQH